MAHPDLFEKPTPTVLAIDNQSLHPDEDVEVVRRTSERVRWMLIADDPNAVLRGP
jgi:hypothetical protein